MLTPAKPSTVSYAERLGRRARDPHLAGLLVGGAALLFTAAWVLAVVATDSVGGTADERLTFVAFFLVVTPPNAYVVTRLAWRLFVAPRRRPSYRLAALVGVVTGVVSYATLSAAFFLAIVGLRTLNGETVRGFVGTPVTLATLPLDTLIYAFVGSLIGLYVTAGIPVVLTVGVALGLVYLHRGVDGRGTPG